jgi:hypothetical protein
VFSAEGICIETQKQKAVHYRKFNRLDSDQYLRLLSAYSLYQAGQHYYFTDLGQADSVAWFLPFITLFAILVDRNIPAVFK